MDTAHSKARCQQSLSSHLPNETLAQPPFFSCFQVSLLCLDHDHMLTIIWRAKNDQWQDLLHCVCMHKAFEGSGAHCVAVAEAANNVDFFAGSGSDGQGCCFTSQTHHHQLPTSYTGANASLQEYNFQTYHFLMVHC